MIFDTFTFWAELDVLEIRLAELYPVVDYFILVEATHTHKGKEKPLFYAENRHRFARFNDKIIQVTVADLPTDTGGLPPVWRREMGQRQAILRGLPMAAPDDIVLVSDLDEIPRREAVAALRGGFPDGMVITFDQTLYYYNVNTSCTNLRWSGTRAAHAADVRVLTPDGVRWSGLRSHEYPIHARLTGDSFGMPGKSAGWHLSYFGDVQHIQAKMRAFLHQELVNEDTTDPDQIARRMAAGLDIWGRESEQRFEIGPAADLPWAMRADPVKHSRFFHPDWRPTFHEDWYVADGCEALGYLAQLAPTDGAIVEIGSWEGKSTAALAQSVAPRPVIAVDHWRGNVDEPGQPAVKEAQARDVRATFRRNMELLTGGNVTACALDWRAWIQKWEAPIAFLHLDAAHDYVSVRDCLLAVQPFLVPGAVLCGDDAYADGVYRATREVLGDEVSEIAGRLWLWQKGQG